MGYLGIPQGYYNPEGPENLSDFTDSTAEIGSYLKDSVVGAGRYIREHPGEPLGYLAERFKEQHPADQFAMATSPIPYLGGAAGNYANIRMLAEEPESRTPFNIAATGVEAMLPAAKYVLPAVASALGLGYMSTRGAGVKNARTSEMGGQQKGALGDFEPATDVTPIDESRMVSTRMPKKSAAGKEGYLDPDENLLLTDMESFNAPGMEGMRSTVANTLRTYPGMGRLASDATDAEVMTEFHKFTKDNLMEIYDRMPPEMRNAAAQWYEGANKIRGGLAKEYGIPGESASAVIAVLSPKTDWDINLSMAERVIDTWSNKKNFRYTPEMEDASKADAFLKRDLDAVRGKTLDELDNLDDKATWLRLYDDAHNPNEYVNWLPDGSRGSTAMGKKGPKQAGIRSQGFGAIRKAVSVLEDPSVRNISSELGGAHKVRNFYNNIENPLSKKFVTSDTHNAAAAMGRPLSLQSPEVLSQFGGKGGGSNALTGHGGTYTPIAEANRAAGAEVGLRPGQMQSIPWVGVRKMFDDQLKTRWGKLESSPTDRIWEAYDKGDITHQEAWDMIEEATGGMAKRKAPYLNPNF